MRTNRSPWIYQLDPARQTKKLARDEETDVAVVGAGIAGVSTAFFLLKYTNKKVLLLDSRRLAHGATGHNAGQVLADFERPFSDIVREFGLDMSCKAWTELVSGWELMSEMYSDAGCDITFSRFPGYIGYSTLQQALIYLEDLDCKERGGVKNERCFISKAAPFLKDIPEKYARLYELTDQEFIQKKLETESPIFHLLVEDRRGVVNSALFSEKVAIYLQNKYKDRFFLFEDTHIAKVVLHDGYALLDAGNFTVRTGQVVLCTNGFENFEIFNKSGLDLDKGFHHEIHSTVGYMSAYEEKMNKPPAGMSYFMQDVDPLHEEDGAFFYLTRRPNDADPGKEKTNLICIGGPEVGLEEREEYFFDYDYPDQMQRDINDFVKGFYDTDPNKKIDFQYAWHGLMGYTPNRIRIVGSEPKNPVLLYNIGCNGIGIIPSVCGGKRVSRIVAGERLEKSIFDPKG